MYLLYLDESGNENDAGNRFFVLAGIALFERQPYFLSKAIDTIQAKYFPAVQPLQFHATDVRSGKGFWRGGPAAQREEILSDLTKAILGSPGRGRKLYAAAVEKSASLWGEDAVERATEEVCRRFDLRLTRIYQEDQEPQRGIIVFSEGRFNTRAKIWVRGFHERGTRWGAINNLADIPYFASPRESRLLQVADLVAHAVWLLYERRDPSLIGPMIHCFDRRDGVLHGLVHVQPPAGTGCECPACFSRRAPGMVGPWLHSSAPKTIAAEPASSIPPSDPSNPEAGSGPAS